MLNNSSISVIQWLLNAETSHPTMSPPHRLNRFFTTLFASLRNPSRAVLQFYPSNDDQVTLITSIAQKAGFGGGIVVDYPNSKKARKVFLCLFVGDGNSQQVPKGLEGEADEKAAKFERRRDREKKRDRNGKRKNVKTKDWILKKKEVMNSTIALSILFIDSHAFIALSPTWKRRCPKGFKIHWKKKANSLLNTLCQYYDGLRTARISKKSSRYKELFTVLYGNFRFTANEKTLQRCHTNSPTLSPFFFNHLL